MRRCRCGKRIFRDEIAAKLFVAYARRKDTEKRRERRVYRCQWGSWHATSEEARCSTREES